MSDAYKVQFENGLREGERRQKAKDADTIESLRSRLAEANTKLSLCAHHVHGSYDSLNTALLPEAVTDDALVLSVARGAANLRSRLEADFEIYHQVYMVLLNAGTDKYLGALEQAQALVARAENAEAALAEAQEELAQWRATGESVTRNEYNLSARLAEADALLREAHDTQWPFMADLADRIAAHLSREQP